MIERRTKITYYRCHQRWRVRDYHFLPVKPLALILLASNAEPPEDMRDHCKAYITMMANRKWLKEPDDPGNYIRAWWKSRGYEIDQN